MRRAIVVLGLLVFGLAPHGAPAAAHHRPNHGGSGGGGDPIPTDRHPILFVHGWSSSGSTWSTMVSRFKADGYTDGELFAWSYSWQQSNATTAEQLAQQVDAILAGTGATRVDVITHSMGGLSSRWCIKFLTCDGKVDAWVSLGGPNHGTNAAYACFTTSCVEMRPNSTFLQQLNAGDETPGTSTRWATWWSPCDGVIDPPESTILSGAQNTQTACISHSALKEDATVYGQVRDHVTAT